MPATLTRAGVGARLRRFSEGGEQDPRLELQQLGSPRDVVALRRATQKPELMLKLGGIRRDAIIGGDLTQSQKTAVERRRE